MVYLDDIILIGNNLEELEGLKKFLAREFVIKDLGPLIYFLSTEIVRSKHEVYLKESTLMVYSRKLVF